MSEERRRAAAAYAEGILARAGKVLERLRREAGIPQCELARRTGVVRETIRLIEQKQLNVSLLTAARLLHGMDRGMEDLLRGLEEEGGERGRGAGQDS